MNTFDETIAPPRRATFHVNATHSQSGPPPLPTRREVRTETPAPKRAAAPIIINWAAVSTVMFASIVSLLIGIAIGADLVADAVSDPFNGVPACTDAIADAGGICHGEPR